MKGFKKDGKFIPTGNKSKSSLKKSDVRKKQTVGVNDPKKEWWDKKSYSEQSEILYPKGIPFEGRVVAQGRYHDAYDNETKGKRNKESIDSAHCSICDQVVTEDKLDRHMINHEHGITSDLDSASCPNCDQVVTEDKIDEHMKSHGRNKESIDDSSSGSYWGSDGKYEDEAKTLTELVPSEGQSEHTDIELWRVAQNVYYDIFNNGGANLMEDWARNDERNALSGSVDTDDLEDYMEVYEAYQKSLNYDSEEEYEEYGNGDFEYTSEYESDKLYKELVASGGQMDKIMDAVIEKIKTMPNNHLEEGGFVRNKKTIDKGQAGDVDDKCNVCGKSLQYGNHDHPSV